MFLWWIHTLSNSYLQNSRNIKVSGILISNQYRTARYLYHHRHLKRMTLNKSMTGHNVNMTSWEKIRWLPLSETLHLLWDLNLLLNANKLLLLIYTYTLVHSYYASGVVYYLQVLTYRRLQLHLVRVVPALYLHITVFVYYCITCIVLAYAQDW